MNKKIIIGIVSILFLALILYFFFSGTSKKSECSSTNDCKNGKVCQNGQCIIPPPECSTNSECKNGQICENGKCVNPPPPPPECSTNSDCKNGQICQNGKCINPPAQCSSDSDCNNINKMCQNGICVCKSQYGGDNCQYYCAQGPPPDFTGKCQCPSRYCGDTCEVDCSENGSCQNGKCVCNDGYRLVNGKCIKKCGEHGIIDDNGNCVCDPCYVLSKVSVNTCDEKCPGGVCTNDTCSSCQQGTQQYGPSCDKTYTCRQNSQFSIAPPCSNDEPCCICDKDSTGKFCGCVRNKNVCNGMGFPKSGNDGIYDPNNPTSACGKVSQDNPCVCENGYLGLNCQCPPQKPDPLSIPLQDQCNGYIDWECGDNGWEKVKTKDCDKLQNFFTNTLKKDFNTVCKPYIDACKGYQNATITCINGTANTDISFECDPFCPPNPNVGDCQQCLPGPSGSVVNDKVCLCNGQTGNWECQTPPNPGTCPDLSKINNVCNGNQLRCLKCPTLQNPEGLVFLCPGVSPPQECLQSLWQLEQDNINNNNIWYSNVTQSPVYPTIDNDQCKTFSNAVATTSLTPADGTYSNAYKNLNPQSTSGFVYNNKQNFTPLTNSYTYNARIGKNGLETNKIIDPITQKPLKCLWDDVPTCNNRGTPLQLCADVNQKFVNCNDPSSYYVFNFGATVNPDGTTTPKDCECGTYMSKAQNKQVKYVGAECEYDDNTTCNGNGIAQDITSTSGKGSCVCNSGFVGDNCEIKGAPYSFQQDGNGNIICQINVGNGVISYSGADDLSSTGTPLKCLIYNISGNGYYIFAILPNGAIKPISINVPELVISNQQPSLFNTGVDLNNSWYVYNTSNNDINFLENASGILGIQPHYKDIVSFSSVAIGYPTVPTDFNSIMTNILTQNFNNSQIQIAKLDRNNTDLLNFAKNFWNTDSKPDNYYLVYGSTYIYKLSYEDASVLRYSCMMQGALANQLLDIDGNIISTLNYIYSGQINNLITSDTLNNIRPPSLTQITFLSNTKDKMLVYQPPSGPSGPQGPNRFCYLSDSRTIIGFRINCGLSEYYNNLNITTKIPNVLPALPFISNYDSSYTDSTNYSLDYGLILSPSQSVQNNQDFSIWNMYNIPNTNSKLLYWGPYIDPANKVVWDDGEVFLVGPNYGPMANQYAFYVPCGNVYNWFLQKGITFQGNLGQFPMYYGGFINPVNC